jgi:hypothetical protein
MVTRPMVVTVAIRSPARMTGVAIGSSTRHRRCRLVYPMPSAASSTSAGTCRSPVTILRTRMTSV